MRKKLSLLLAALMIATLLLTGCASGQKGSDTAGTPADENESQAPEVVLLGFYEDEPSYGKTERTLRYDETGHVTELHFVEPVYDITYLASYDEAGRLTEEGRTEQLIGDYDPGSGPYYTYDENGLLSEIRSETSAYNWVTVIEHDADGQIISAVRNAQPAGMEEYADAYIADEYAAGPTAWTYEIQNDPDGGKTVTVTVTSQEDKPKQSQSYGEDGVVVRAHDEGMMGVDSWVFDDAFSIFEVEQDQIPGFCSACADEIRCPSHFIHSDEDSYETVEVSSGYVVTRSVQNGENREPATQTLVYGRIGDDPAALLAEAETVRNQQVQASFPDWSAAYRNFVENRGYLTAGEATFFDDEEPSCGLYDMNADGIPELLITNGSIIHASATTYAYTFVNGTVTLLGTVGNYPFDVYASKNAACPGLFAVYGNMGMFTYEYYTLADNTLQSEIVMTSLTESDAAGTIYERSTQDDALYETCMEIFEGWIDADSSYEPIKLYSMQEMRTMGWDAFAATF